MEQLNGNRRTSKAPFEVLARHYQTGQPDPSKGHPMTTSGSAAIPENPAPSSIPPPSDQAPHSDFDAGAHGAPDEGRAPSGEFEQRPSFYFDPQASVEIGSALDHFEQVGNAALTRAMSHLAHTTSACDISKFASFDDGAISVTTGKFSFTVNRDRLCLAIVDVCTAARMPVRDKASNWYSVRLCLSEVEIKLTTFDPPFFCLVRRICGRHQALAVCQVRDTARFL
jgi:hypothetical protein